MSSSVNHQTADTYPGGDTSFTFQIRSTYVGTISLVDSVETVLPVLDTVEAGNIGCFPVSTSVLRVDHDGTVTGALEIHVHTTGPTVEFNVWLEISPDAGVTWIPVPNSLKKSQIPG